jgi:hypothetical protein
MIRLIGLIVVCIMVIVTVLPDAVKAATTATVTINATPTWVAITNTNSNVYVVPTSITASTDLTPVAISASPTTAAGFFSLVSQSTVAVNVSIWAVNFTGGSVWTLSDSAVSGSAIAGMYAGIVSGTFNTVIKTSPGSVLKSLAANVNGSVNSASQTWHLKVMIPTVFQDGVQKSTTITLSAAAS